MSQSRNSLASIIFVVVMLILIAIATKIYSGDQKQQQDLSGQPFWRETKMVIDYFLGKDTNNATSSSEENAPLDPGAGVNNQEADKTASSVVGNIIDATNNPSKAPASWQELKDQVTQQMDKNTQNFIQSETETKVEGQLRTIMDEQKTAFWPKVLNLVDIFKESVGWNK